MYTEQNYFEKTFDTMHTYTIGEWMREAQLQLPHYSGSARLLLLEGIRAASRELLYRWRLEVRN